MSCVCNFYFWAVLTECRALAPFHCYSSFLVCLPFCTENVDNYRKLPLSDNYNTCFLLPSPYLPFPLPFQIHHVPPSFFPRCCSSYSLQSTTSTSLSRHFHSIRFRLSCLLPFPSPKSSLRFPANQTAPLRFHGSCLLSFPSRPRHS